MSLELFKKIADDMRAFPDRIKELLLYKDGEPLLNPSIVEMIAYAKARNVAQKVALVTNGSLLTDERINGLLSAGLDAIKISVEHMTDEGYARVARANCSYREIHTRVARLFAERERRSHPLLIDLKVLDIDLAEAERVRFIEDYAPICDYMHFGTLMGWSRSDRKDFTLGQKVSRGMDSLNVLSPERLVCPNPFKTLAVNFDGSVTVCCVDWSHALCVGDVKSEPLTEIWRGERLRTLREVHLRGQRGRYSACANCQYFQGMHPINDLDHHAERLLPLYGLESLSSPLADSRANQDSQSKERR
jgi:radical SAM protein with 4Fe4S-binding SPASM domain